MISGSDCKSAFSTVAIDMNNDRYYDDLGDGGSLIPGRNQDPNTWCLYEFNDDPKNCIGNFTRITIGNTLGSGAPECVNYHTGYRRYSFEHLVDNPEVSSDLVWTALSIARPMTLDNIYVLG